MTLNDDYLEALAQLASQGDPQAAREFNALTNRTGLFQNDMILNVLGMANRGRLTEHGRTKKLSAGQAVGLALAGGISQYLQDKQSKASAGRLLDYMKESRARKKAEDIEDYRTKRQIDRDYGPKKWDTFLNRKTGSAMQIEEGAAIPEGYTTSGAYIVEQQGKSADKPTYNIKLTIKTKDGKIYAITAPNNMDAKKYVDTAYPGSEIVDETRPGETMTVNTDTEIQQVDKITGKKLWGIPKEQTKDQLLKKQREAQDYVSKNVANGLFTVDQGTQYLIDNGGFPSVEIRKVPNEQYIAGGNSPQYYDIPVGVNDVNGSQANKYQQQNEKNKLIQEYLKEQKKAQY